MLSVGYQTFCGDCSCGAPGAGGAFARQAFVDISCMLPQRPNALKTEDRPKHTNDVKKHIQQFVYFYNFKRLHQNLNYNTPNNVYNKIVDGHSFIYAKVEKKRSQK